MGRHPVEDHAQSRLVAAIHEGAELVGRAVAAGGREVAAALVAPGFVQRVLGHRQQLDVGEAHVQRVGNQVGGELRPVPEAPVGMALPRSGVDLVDVHGRTQPVAPGARLHPCGIAPLVRRRRGHAGGRARTQLEAAAVGIGLDHHRTTGAVADLELVERAGPQPGHEQLPQAAAAVHLHGVGAAIPAVEVAHHAHALGIGRPAHEAHAGHPAAGAAVGTQHAPGLGEAPLVEEVAVVVGGLGGEAPRAGHGHAPVAALHLDHGRITGLAGPAPLEQSSASGAKGLPRTIRQQPRRTGLGIEVPHDPS